MEEQRDGTARSSSPTDIRRHSDSPRFRQTQLCIAVITGNVISWFFIRTPISYEYFGTLDPHPPPSNLANVRTSDQKATRHRLLKGPKISFKYCATQHVKIWLFFIAEYIIQF